MALRPAVDFSSSHESQITSELNTALPAERLGLQYSQNPTAPGGNARLDWALCQWMAKEKGVLIHSFLGKGHWRGHRTSLFMWLFKDG